MSISRSLLAGGPAYVSFNGANIPLGEDSRLEIAPAWGTLSTALNGEIDDIYQDLIIKGTGTPLTYDNLATLWPYLQPNIGKRIFGDADVPFLWWSNNGDKVLVTAGAVTKMPDLYLGVDKPALGPMEFSGVCGTGLDPDTVNSYYTLSNVAYVAPAVTASKILRQKYTGVWGTQGGFTAITAQEGWTISHELKLSPVKNQGRTVDMKILSYRAMARCMPGEATMAQIDAALGAQGVMKQGAFLSSNASKHDLVISGQMSAVVTVKNAALKTAGFLFGGKPLRNGELGWVSTIDVSTGTATAALVLA